jgi:hypothetical protein
MFLFAVPQDAFELYHKYEYPSRANRDADWKTLALRGPALPALGHAVAGAAGSAVSNMATYPLSLIVTRMQIQRVASKRRKNSAKSAAGSNDPATEYKSIPDAARKIYANEGGLSAFYVGAAQDTGKTIADSFIFFLAYTFLRERRLRTAGATLNGKKRTVLPVLDELAIGVIAGAFSKFLTTPLANIVTRKQTAAMGGNADPSTSSTRHIATEIRAEKGITGFWSGYAASIVLTLNPSITFFLNEFLRYLLLPRKKERKPSPALTFLIAATSKAVASSITYPVSLAKTRTQAHSTDSEGKRAATGSDDELRAFTPLSVFSTLQTILLTEGVGALYDGLQGEVLKGFFTHGLTMLTKDVVHSAIVRSYYILLVLLRRYPSPEVLLQQAREQAEEYADAAREAGRDLSQSIIGQTGADSLGKTPIHTDPSSALPSITDTNELAEMVAEYVEDEAEEWRSLYHWFWERWYRNDQ